MLKYYPNFSKEIDRGALKRYVRLGYIPAPQSIYNNFYKLIPGTYLRVMLENFNSDKFSPYPSSQDISFCPHYYWNPAVKMAERLAAQDGFDYSSGKQSFKRILQEAIEAHLVSDVPVGSFLSGGIDSSLVTAIMKEVSPSPVKTFTIGFGDSKYNEADYARKIAAFLGTDHTEMYVTERDALNVVVKLPYIYSEPFADSSQIPTLMLSELTRNSVTVALSGDGGDELFGGYERYIVARNIWEVSRLLPVGIKKLLYNFFQRLPESVYPYLLKPFTYIVPRDLHKKVSGSIYENGINVALSPCKKSLYLNQVSQQYQPGKLVMTNEEEDLYPFTSDFCISASLVENFQAIDFLTYLPEDILCKVDRASMAVSLETRIPLLDHKVVEYAWTVPSQFKLHKNESKILLRDLL